MDIRKRLETDLKEVVGRLRQLGGSAALEELLGPGEHWSFADEVDEIQANERREIGFATRELLVERINRITAALDRLNDGEYGICVECSEKIAAARRRSYGLRIAWSLTTLIGRRARPRSHRSGSVRGSESAPASIR